MVKKEKLIKKREMVKREKNMIKRDKDMIYILRDMGKGENIFFSFERWNGVRILIDLVIILIF